MVCFCYKGTMEREVQVQGRLLSGSDIIYLRELIKSNPSWSRRRLSEELCRAWNWRNSKGVFKDMASRAMMLKLEKRGYITLPPRRRIPVNRMLEKKRIYVEHEQSPVDCILKELQPLRISPVLAKEKQENLYSCLLSEYHYKSYKGIVGENMRYLIYDCQGRVLSCLLFGSSAWSVQSRDTHIGWNSQMRASNLHLTTNNMRFLILPWVRVPHLASHILGLVSRRISKDWESRYGHPLYLLETFVERDRFKGTCYKAANWRYVGQTKGRSRNDRYNRLQVPIKDVYLYPLYSNYKKKLVSCLKN